jgi:DNA-3-methyladenine glycosylase II
MPRRLPYAEEAVRHLRRRDRALRDIIDRVGPYAPRLQKDRFVALAGSIVSQQISTTAARTIYGRLVGLVAPRPLDPAGVLSLSDDQLRSAGLSRAKALYLRDLAERVAAGHVRLRSLHRADDEAVIEHLVQVKGIGRWTAEMFLIFSLGRPDVLPVDDLGLRAGLMRCDGLPELPTKADVRQRGAAWQPFRSVGTWYLWQSLKPEFGVNGGRPA